MGSREQKATIINLLMRFYDIWDGNICGWERYQRCDKKSLRKSYAMVLQDTWLFSGSIYDNIAYGKEDATMEEVIEAAKMAGIHSYIRRLPDGQHHY